MTEYSVAEAKAKLSELIDRAGKGESVTITNHGTPVAELKGAQPLGRIMTQADLDWLAERRAKIKVRKGGPNAVEIIRQMREDY